MTINANTVSLAAGSEAGIGAGEGVGAFAFVSAKNGGAANLIANRDLDITAKTAFSMTLTGSASRGSLEIFAGEDIGYGGYALVGNGGGKATKTISDDVNLNVTGATGTITLNTGKHKDAGVDIYTGSQIGDGASSPSHHAYASAGRGGSANVTVSTDVNLTAKGAITLTAGAASAGIYIVDGGYDADRVEVFASSGGKATANIQAMANINGGSVTLTAAGNITITAASGVAEQAGAIARLGGNATLDVLAGTKITTKGAFVAVAGSEAVMLVNGISHSASLGDNGVAFAFSGAAHATVSGVDDLQITAGSVSITATKGLLALAGASDVAESAHVAAQTKNDVANFSAVADLDITTTGAITLVAGKQILIVDGNDLGNSAGASAGTGPFGPGSYRGATANLTAESAINLKAGGAFTAAAGSSVKLSNGRDTGESAHVLALGPTQVAKATITGGISVTAASIALTGGDSLLIQGDSITGLDAGVIGIFDARASFTANAAIALNATGNVTLTAKTGRIEIDAGNGAFTHGGIEALASGSGAQANALVNSGVSIHAGGNLTVNAKKGAVSISGGNEIFGSVAGIDASASLTLDANVNLSAGKNLSLTAGGGNLTIKGGDAGGLVADVLPSHSFGPSGVSAGVAIGVLNTGVTLTAGSNATLTAHGNVTVAAGAGETVAVGKYHKFSSGGGIVGSTSYVAGNSWGGGLASLSGNDGATVTAGKSITVTAGTGGSGNIVIQGLGQNPGQANGYFNIVSVRGGSSHAVANLTFDGNAALNAGSNIVLNAKGNASILGGSFYELRADHALGNVTITGSADASLTAGHDVVFGAIAGSVTVAAGGNAANAKGVLIDAHGDSGSADVTGHEDASVAAGFDILTTTAIGRNLNVIGGKDMEAAAVGSASGGLQQANATANASMTAGDVISISGTGDLNVLGGVFGFATGSVAVIHHASSSFFASGARRSANLQLKSTLTGINGVTLAFKGDGVIAAGDSIHASGSVDAVLSSVSVTDDASTTISGKNVAITVAGNLLVRAGGSAGVGGNVGGDDNSATMTTKANLNLTATGNITITAGTGTNVNQASFVAGNVPTAKLKVFGGKFGSGSTAASSGGNHANGDVNTDLNVAAGGNIALNIHGNLNITGGQAVGGSGYVMAGQPYSFGSITKFTGNGGLAAANISGKTVFNAGGNLTVTLHGGTVNLAGGYQAGTNAVIDTAVTGGSGTAARATYNLDESLTMKAAGAFAIVGAAATSTGVTVSTQVPTTSSFGPYLYPAGSHTSVTVTANSTVTLSGKTLNINGAHHTVNSAGTFGFSSPAVGSFGAGNLFMDGRIHLLANGEPVTSVAPLSVELHTLEFTRESLEVAPQESGVSFGAPRTLSIMDVTTPQPAVQPATQVDLTDGVVLQSVESILGTVQSLSPVMSLVTVVAPANGGVSLAQPTVTVFDPAVSLSTVTSSGACTALVVRDSGGYRCGAGGR